jgi:hypothetical protein
LNACSHISNKRSEDADRVSEIVKKSLQIGILVL